MVHMLIINLWQIIYKNNLLQENSPFYAEIDNLRQTMPWYQGIGISAVIKYNYMYTENLSLIISAISFFRAEYHAVL